MRITTNPATRLTTAVESYFTDLRRIRATGGATGERLQTEARALERVESNRWSR